jgi:hypothetical protein
MITFSLATFERSNQNVKVNFLESKNVFWLDGDSQSE